MCKTSSKWTSTYFLKLLSVTSALLVTACAVGDSGNGDIEKQISSGPFGKYDPPITVETCKQVYPFLQFPEGDSIDENIWTRAYRDRLGINVVYAWTADSWTSYEQKLNINVATDATPDMFGVVQETYVKLANSGLIHDLTDILLEYLSDDGKSIYDENPITLKSLEVNGRIMGLSGATTPTTTLLWIRTDWLEKLGLSEPTTTEEFFEIADAFANQDPDGNGQKDTFAFPLDKEIFGGNFKGLSAMHGSYTNTWIKGEDGTIVFGNIQPQTKVVLGKLAELYKNSIIDPEFGVKNNAAIKTDISSGKFGMVFSGTSMPDGVKELRDNDPSAEWKAIAMPTSGGSVAKTPVSLRPGLVFVVKKDFDYPEALVKIANLNYELLDSDNSQAEYHTGPNKETLFFATAGTSLGRSRESSNKRQLALNNAIEAGVFEGQGLPELYRTYFDSIMLYKETGTNEAYGAYKVFGKDGSRMLEEQLLDQEAYIIDELYGPQPKTLVDKGATLYKLGQESFVKIVTGVETVDYFDKYVQEWTNQGGAQATAEINDWHKAQTD